MFGGMKIGRIAGIPFLVNPTWFLVFALVAYTVSTQELPYLLAGRSDWVYWVVGGLLTLLYFASLLAHELGHSLASKHYGIPVLSITLYLFGGVAQIGKEVSRAREEFVIAIAGPAVSLVLGGIFWGVGVLLEGPLPIVGVPLQLLGLLNLVVLLFNLIPGFPLDGGRVLRSIIWGVTHDYLKATRIAAFSGQGFGFALIAVGAYLAIVKVDTSAIWTVFVGLFLVTLARGSRNQAEMRATLQGRKMSELMTRLISVPATLTIDELYAGYIRTTGRPVYLVEMYGKPAGLVWTQVIERVPHNRWNDTALAMVMQSILLVPSVPSDASMEQALLAMNESGADLLLVLDLDQPIGVVTRNQILQSLTSRQDAR